MHTFLEKLQSVNDLTGAVVLVIVIVGLVVVAYLHTFLQWQWLVILFITSKLCESETL